VSVVLCTYNRAALLGPALASLLAQAGSPPFELLVVDNNSRDRTQDVIAAAAGGDPRVRPLFEARQGLSPARNTAIASARGPLVAFTDDDVRAEPDWVASMARAFTEHPGASMVGGRVLPDWPPSGPPSWLTPAHWAPLALVDYGDAMVRVSAERPLCLIGANMAFRREVFDTVGLFEPSLGRVGGGIGSLEDHDFLLRCYRAGLHGVFDPRIVIHADVQPDRLARAYHRRWHAGHGRFHAMMRSESMERSRAGSLGGVPAHLYRQALADVAGWMRAVVAGRESDAFARELKLRFFAGFARERLGQARSAGTPGLGDEIAHLARALASRLARTRRAGEAA
jgi:glycosyltransferase involved in cell wall biosynthesis